MCRTPAANAAPLLLVGGYRDNEVTSAAHPLWMFLDEIRNKGVASNTINLQVNNSSTCGLEVVHRTLSLTPHPSDATAA
jgi:hypothetical protein